MDSLCRIRNIIIYGFIMSCKKYNNICTLMMNCFCTDSSVIKVFISLITSQLGSNLTCERWNSLSLEYMHYSIHFVWLNSGTSSLQNVHRCDDDWNRWCSRSMHPPPHGIYMYHLKWCKQGPSHDIRYVCNICCLVVSVWLGYIPINSLNFYYMKTFGS